MPRYLRFQGLNASFNRRVAGVNSWLGTEHRGFKQLLRHEKGASAIEFALLAPLLIGGIMFAGMAGVQLKNYIVLNQVLRAGAVVAHDDPGAPAILQHMTAAAVAKGYIINTQGGDIPDRLALTSTRVCNCPGTTFPQGCEVVCAGQRPATVAYVLTARYPNALVTNFLTIASRFLRYAFGMQIVNLQTRVLIR